MNDVVVRRIFAAGLDLQAALGLIGDHSGAGKIYHALDELDQAIRDIRDTIFDRSPPGSPRFSHQDARRTALYADPRESGADGAVLRLVNGAARGYGVTRRNVGRSQPWALSE